MNMLSFATWQFAALGAALALGPVVIHLLNRRRYRVVDWAAMEFLREAVKRNRRMLRIRDLLLLLLRSAAVLLFGLALAQPFLAGAGDRRIDQKQPVHAVLLMDNSTSMAYRTMAESLLDVARDRARGYVAALPRGSRVSVIPLCGSRNGFTVEPFSTVEAAREALGRVEIVDRTADITSTLDLARTACRVLPEMSKRLVLLSDQQSVNWAGMSNGNDIRELPLLDGLPPLQLVDCSAGADAENTWIEDLYVQDGIADVQTPCTIVVRVRHRGSRPRENVQVTLRVDDVDVASRTVTLEPSQGSREISFRHLFSGHRPDSEGPSLARVAAYLSSDRLPDDDRRDLVLPVVASLPVVFIDQTGDQEDPLKQRLGETRHLRKLLAPGSDRADSDRSLVSIRHLRIDEVEADKIADARAVIVAGVRDPGNAVPVLRRYALEGGQLLIAAGADFDPKAWNDAAWLDGDGILPAPLGPHPIGSLPDVAGELEPMFLSYESLEGHRYFQLAGVPEEELRALYAEPFFFQLVDVRVPDDAIVAAGDRQADAAPEDSDAGRNAPTVLARLVEPRGPVLLVERPLGKGRCVFMASGLLSPWNTLPKTNAIVMFDRIARDMILSTLPRRNFPPREQLTLSISDDARDLAVRLYRPTDDRSFEPLDVGFVGSDRFGVNLNHLLTRGIYRVAGYRTDGESRVATSDAETAPAWQIPIAVHASSDESDLSVVDRQTMQPLIDAGGVEWVGPQEEIRVDGVFHRARDSWWYLALIVLLLLLFEMAVLAWPTIGSLLGG